MAHSIGLAPYAVRIWDKNERDYCRLDKLPITDPDFYSNLKTYLQNRKDEKSVFSDKQSVIKVDILVSDDESCSIEGVFKAGTYGFSAELENLQTGVVRNRSIDDCEYLPLYFNFQFKAGQNEAILILQRFGIFGVKTTLYDDLSMYINGIDPNLRLEINPLVSDSQIEELMGGSIKKIRYLKFSVPDDIANDIEEIDNLEDNAEMEMVIKAKRNKFLGTPNWMKDVFSGKAATSDIIEINGIEYDNIKVEIDLDGKKKTLNVSDIRKMRMNFDITDNITFGADGHPTFDSIREEGEDLLPDLEKALRWDND